MTKKNWYSRDFKAKGWTVIRAFSRNHPDKIEQVRGLLKAAERNGVLQSPYPSNVIKHILFIVKKGGHKAVRRAIRRTQEEIHPNLEEALEAARANRVRNLIRRRHPQATGTWMENIRGSEPEKILETLAKLENNGIKLHLFAQYLDLHPHSSRQYATQLKHEAVRASRRGNEKLEKAIEQLHLGKNLAHSWGHRIRINRAIGQLNHLLKHARSPEDSKWIRYAADCDYDPDAIREAAENQHGEAITRHALLKSRGVEGDAFEELMKLDAIDHLSLRWAVDRVGTSDVRRIRAFGIIKKHFPKGAVRAWIKGLREPDDAFYHASHLLDGQTAETPKRVSQFFEDTYGLPAEDRHGAVVAASWHGINASITAMAAGAKGADIHRLAGARRNLAFHMEPAKFSELVSMHKPLAEKIVKSMPAAAKERLRRAFK